MSLMLLWTHDDAGGSTINARPVRSLMGVGFSILAAAWGFLLTQLDRFGSG